LQFFPISCKILIIGFKKHITERFKFMRVYYGEVYRNGTLVATTSNYSHLPSVRRAVNNLKNIFQEPEEVLGMQIQKSKKVKK
jgi:hypothetical protein